MILPYGQQPPPDAILCPMADEHRPAPRYTASRPPRRPTGRLRWRALLTDENGQVVGGVGVSAGTVEQDHDVTAASAAAF
jgi:hypothetical protein